MTSYGIAHAANQDIIEAALKDEKTKGYIDSLALEVLAEDGRRAQATLELIRSRCVHEYDWNDAAGLCLFCGDQAIPEAPDYD